jgi:hypothetical protein
MGLSKGVVDKAALLGTEGDRDETEFRGFE